MQLGRASGELRGEALGGEVEPARFRAVAQHHALAEIDAAQLVLHLVHAALGDEEEVGVEHRWARFFIPELHIRKIAELPAEWESIAEDVARELAASGALCGDGTQRLQHL